MNSGVYCLLTLALIIANIPSCQLGHDKKVKMNVMLNTTEDGFVKASLYITNATSTMLNNASLIVSMEALLLENNTVIGAVGYMRDSRVNGSVNFSSIDEMENLQKLNRCQSSKEKEVKELQLANEEMRRNLSSKEDENQELKSSKSKVEEEVEKVQLANEEMRRNLSSKEDENQELRSSKSKVEEEVRQLQIANGEMKRKLSSQEDKIQELRSSKTKVEEEVRQLQIANGEMKRKLSSQEDEIQKLRPFSLKVSLLEKGYEIIKGMGFYKFHSNKADWADFQYAVRICENEGGHLGVIDSEKEAEEFTKLIRKNGDNFIWVGIHDPHRNRSFQSILGTPLNALGYSKWGSGEPNNGNGNEYCVFYLVGYGLGDGLCDWNGSFICEIEI